MDIGAYTTEGFALGISSESDAVRRAAQSLANLAQPKGAQYAPIYGGAQAFTQATRPTPATFYLQLGSRNFKAVVRDISTAQAQAAQFEEVYSYV